MTNTQPTALTQKQRLFFGTITLVVIAAFLFLYDLGKEPFRDYDEATYAQVIDDTKASGQLLTLQHLSSDWYEKPPLYMWSAMLTGAKIHSKEFAYRFPSALAGIVSVVLVLLIVFSLTKNEVAALLGGAILLTSPLYIEAARQLRLDVPVTLAMLIAFYAFIRGLKNPQWYVSIGVAIALGVMIKSVIALFVLPLFLIWSVIKKDFSWLRSTYVWVGLGAGALVVLPWHIHESMQAGSTFWDSYLFHQVLSRFGSDILGGSTTSVTYLTYLATFALPWTLLFLIGGSTSLLFFYKNNKDDFKNQLILFVYVFCLLAIYFVAQTKIVYYLTPVYPFIAIFGGLVGSTIFGTLHKKKNEYMFYTISVLITIGALVYTTYIGFHAQADFLTDSHAVTEEMQIGTRLASEPLTQTIYTLDYPNNQTIIYYSNGRTPAAIPQQAVLSGPLDIILFKKRYDNGPLPDILRTHSTVEYNGNVLMLLHYTP